MHHFCPSGLHQIDKNIIFVLDASERSQLDEIKTVLQDLLDDLRPGDLFNIVSYSSTLTYCNSSSLMPVTSANIASAKSFISSVNSTIGPFVSSNSIHTISLLSYLICNNFALLS